MNSKSQGQSPWIEKKKLWRGQSLFIFLFVLAMLGITAHHALIGIARASPLWAKGFSYQADVRDISGTKYFPAVKEAISKAQNSINIAMFTIESSLARQDSEPNQLIDALIEAKNRGVDVEVILDQNVDFVSRHPAASDRRRATLLWGETKIKSTRAYKRLKDAGVKVYYDEPARYTHAKAVVIDRKIVILGSTNWTESAFNSNIETDVLIDSQKLAGEILSYLKTIKIDESIGEYLESIGPSTPISWEFMEDPGLAPCMVGDQDERAFDIYLYLMKNYNGNSEGKIILFYNILAKYLGIYDGWTSEAYRRQIIKVLRKLEQKYKLIKFEPRYAKEAAITLLNHEDPAKVYEIPEEQYFDLPDDYFELGWNRILSFRAKFCYFINLAYSNISDTKPYWSKGVETITKQFGGISRYVIFKGMGELRREKLIEVQYDELGSKPYEQRFPKMYKILKLYNPEELKLKLKGIEEKYGEKAYAQAMKYGKIVFEENSPEVIEDIILKTKEYGEKRVKNAFDIIAQKSTDNPRRAYNYAVGIIENLK